jgi:hypothetical protein
LLFCENHKNSLLSGRYRHATLPKAGAPKVEQWKYPFVGDKDVTMIERVIIDLTAATPILSEPRAQPLAFDLAESMGRIYDAADCSGSKRTWAWRHEEHKIQP